MPGAVNTYNLAIVFFVGLGSFTYGFNNSIMGTVQGLDSFYQYFDLSSTGPRASYTTSIIGTVQGIFYAGGIIGCGIVAWLADKVGRRLSIQITCAICIISAIIQAASVHIAMLLVARFFNGVGSSMINTLIPLYQSEVSPPSSRGRMVGSHGFLIVTGYAHSARKAFAAWTGLGCYFEQNPQIQWRLCLALQIVAPLLLGAGSPFFPESPRWLVARGHKDLALDILVQLHDSGVADEEYDLAHQEFAQIESHIRQEAEQSDSFLEIMRVPSYRKRFLIAVFVQCLGQSTGVLVVNNYQVMLYNTLGLYGSMPLMLYGVYTTWAALLNFIGSLVVDRVGRVAMLCIGMVGCALCVACEAAMVGKYSGTDNKIGNGFGVFFLFLFVTFYGSCVDAISYVYCAELFPMRLRAQGVATCIMGMFAMTLIYTETAPVGFDQVGWKYYLVFVIIPLVGAPLMWLKFPETKGLSLEEVARLFGDEVVVSSADGFHEDPTDEKSPDVKLAVK
ncbi:uncharacterized protein N7459_002912 [Penicillium hispanicum]|uniref:uncharacterized protein n=1 Tax=Penicillium hispanicum TaxID=1080232 RepID=UPI00254093A0|nr:uncharacterized protein N7459_002912 [Penicillium hispanicum]KAJ5587147.1 hypothetical protein N7459_002912 [Penicillium hispanicum]